jgi:hypothetical protein
MFGTASDAVLKNLSNLAILSIFRRHCGLFFLFLHNILAAVEFHSIYTVRRQARWD